MAETIIKNINDVVFKLTELDTGKVHRFKFSDLEADDYGLGVYTTDGYIHVYGNAVCYSWQDNNYINPSIKLEVEVEEFVL